MSLPVERFTSEQKEYIKVGAISIQAACWCVLTSLDKMLRAGTVKSQPFVIEAKPTPSRPLVVRKLVPSTHHRRPRLFGDQKLSLPSGGAFQFVDLPAELYGEALGFSLGCAGGLECLAKLIVRELADDARKPTRVFERHAAAC